MTKTSLRSCCFFLILLLSCWPPARAAAQQIGQTVRVSEDMDVIRLSRRAYLHVSRQEMPPFGLVPANGVILVDKGEAFLFDTPWTQAQTEALLDWIENVLHARVTAFVPNHWHKDAMGGLPVVLRRGIPAYAHDATIAMAAQKGLQQPQYGFADERRLQLHELEVRCVYLGAGHSTDGIFVWIAAEKLLFPSCMVKELQATDLGNTEDADTRAWPRTLEKALRAFPEARMVIPGHGQPGGLELLRHTRDLAARQSGAR